MLKINGFMKLMKLIFAKWILKTTLKSVLVYLSGALQCKSGLFSCTADLPDLRKLKL